MNTKGHGFAGFVVNPSPALNSNIASSVTPSCLSSRPQLGQSFSAGSSALSDTIATSHMGLLKFEWITMKPHQTFRSSVALTTCHAQLPHVVLGCDGQCSIEHLYYQRRFSWTVLIRQAAPTNTYSPLAPRRLEPQENRTIYLLASCLSPSAWHTQVLDKRSFNECAILTGPHIFGTPSLLTSVSPRFLH